MGAFEEESEKLRQYYKEARAKGIDITKRFLEDRKKAFRKMSKRLPLLWHTIMAKKYILPNYRQSDYVSQEVWDYFMFEMVYSQAMGKFERASHDEVMNTQWIGFIMNMKYGRPTYYLESELGKPLLATNLPEDLELEELKWQFPAMRVYLPKGLLTINRNNEECSLAYIDIIKVEKDIPYEIDRKLAIELILKEGADIRDILALKNAYSGMGVAGVLDMGCSEGPIGYAATTPIHETTIREVFQKWRFHELAAPIKSDEIDRVLTDSMLRLAFNILMVMGAYPIEYQSSQGKAEESKEDTIRPPKMEGKHMLPGLYKAKFIGAQLLRAKRQELIAAGKHIPTGQHVVFHWRKGHWKRVWYGPKKGQWRRQWIEMYSAGKEE